MTANKKMTINDTITSFRRHLQKVPCTWKCLSPFFFIHLFFFSFSSGCDRYVENGDECCNRTFLDHLLPTLWKMLPIFYSFVYRKRILTPQTRLFYSTWTKVPCHRLGNRWDKMSVCSDIHRFLYMYALIDRLK